MVHLAQIKPDSVLIVAESQSAVQDWQLYFDPIAAVESVRDHVETLPGSRFERHTMRAYMKSLGDYCGFLGAFVIHLKGERYSFDFREMEMPTQARTKSYLAKLRRDGKASKTVTRYMASVRHFLRALEEQQVIPKSGNDFVFIMESQRQFRLARGVKNPPADTTSNRPALEQHGTRLNLMQVNQLLSSFQPKMTDLPDVDTVAGKRDLAILYLGITSGLRAAELARMTLNSIKQGTDCYEVHVRGKRNNADPIGIDSTAYELIQSYVAAFNAKLGEDDERRIDVDTALWQPMLSSDKIPSVGLRGNTAQGGLGARAILKIVARRAEAALGIKFSAHDMRRTCAYLMRSHGFEWDQIRGQLRHKSIGTTEKYVGQAQDLSKALLSKRVAFDVPEITSPPSPLSTTIR